MSAIPGEVLTMMALGLYVTWKEIIPRLMVDAGRGKVNGKANGRAGEQSTDFWRLEFRQAQRESLEQLLVPKFDQQIAIFEEIREGMIKTNEALAVLLARKR